MESKDSSKRKLYKSNAFQHVLGYYDQKQLLKFRTVSQKMAYDIVPRCFNYLKYDCPEEDEDQEYTFQRLVRHAKKLEIRNICGTEYHLKKIEELAKNQLGQTEYLYLEFDDDDAYTDSDELAKQYVEVFRQYFPKIRTLKIDTIGDRNFTKMLKIMIDDPHFPWFESVEIIKCYQIINLKDMDLMKFFFTKFRNLRTLKGITEEDFNPLDMFIKEGKKVPCISWTLPQKEDLLHKVLEFLQFNQTNDLKLYGGTLDKIKVDTLYLSHTKHLTLQHMPTLELDSIFGTLPELTTFRVLDVSSFNQEMLSRVASKMSTYKGLETLGLELLNFNLENVKEEFFSILRQHSATLKNLYIGRNYLSNNFIKEMCNEIKEDCRIETLDLTHLIKINEIDWNVFLQSIAMLSENRPGSPIRIKVSDYQTSLKHDVFFQYLEKNKPNIQIHYL